MILKAQACKILKVNDGKDDSHLRLWDSSFKIALQILMVMKMVILLIMRSASYFKQYLLAGWANLDGDDDNDDDEDDDNNNDGDDDEGDDDDKLLFNLSASYLLAAVPTLSL